MKKVKSNSESVSYLNQIINTQSCLAEADFNLQEFMQLIVLQMQKLTPATGVVVELVEGDEMVYRAASGTVADYVGLRLKIENSISGLCIRENEILRSDDTELDPRVNLEACRKVKARSLVVTPLVHQGGAIGVLKILSKNAEAFSEQDENILQLMAGFIASGVAHQQFYETNQTLLHERTEALHELQIAQEKLQYLAHHDFLTNLPNRSMFTKKLNDAISKSKRHQSTMALFFLDIDHFKSINDNLGHDVGDELLKQFANRIKKAIRDYDFAARLGGDEFVIFLEDLDDPQTAIHTAEKIIKTMSDKFKLKKTSLNITTSIGVSFNQGKDITSDELLKQADQALYRAKNGGRNQFNIFESEE